MAGTAGDFAKEVAPVFFPRDDEINIADLLLPRKGSVVKVVVKDEVFELMFFLDT
jgi:hypothetical protein